MEKVQKKKSKVPTTNEGPRQTQRQSVPKLASGCSSHRGGTTKEELAMCELGGSSSRRVTGTPMKKLLAEEMSKEIDCKRWSPSAIARLMGLEGLPPQQPLHKHDNSEKYQQQTASTLIERDGKPHERRLNGKNSVERQEFKDVYEVSETSKVDRGSRPTKVIANPKVSEAEMASIKKNFMNAKHPDYLFKKHFLHLHAAAPRSKCSYIAVMKPTNSEKYESNIIGGKSEKQASQHHTRSRWKHRDGLSIHSFSQCDVQTPIKSSKSLLDGNYEREILPIRIVVLKPNLEQVGNAAKSVSSDCSSQGYRSDCRKHMEYLSTGSGEAAPHGKKNISSDAGFSGPKYGESRDIAKKITRRMRASLGSERIDLPSMFRGYAGDESSCNVSGSDSTSESEVTVRTSRNSFHRSNLQKPPSLLSTKSTVSKEAKKRLSERWKLSQRYQDVGAVGKCSTMGELLAIPSKGMRLVTLDQMIGLDGSSDRFAGNKEIAEWDSPLGLVSSDGWKDGCIRSSSRCGIIDQDSYLMPGEAMGQGRNKAIKGNFNNKEGSSSRNLRSGNKKCRSPCRSYSYCNDSLEEVQFNQFQMEINLEKKDPSEQKSFASEMPAISVDSKISIISVDMVVEHEDVTISSESPDELPPKPSPCLLSIPASEFSKAQEPHFGQSEEHSAPLQCPVPESSSPESSTEAEHPSPVSVLEVPFTEDVSFGFGCFERVSADLQELRMQLKLLKMENEEYADEEMLMSSDKDVGPESVTVDDGNLESSYLVDVLINSGFHDADPDTIMATWHSPECPLGPCVFDNLEKKYSNKTTWSRPERRLLFDRINSGLVELFQWFTDPPHTRVKPPTRMVGLQRQNRGLKCELQKLLASEEEKASEDATERNLDREKQWLGFAEDIDAIGKEVEKLMIDDLIAEIAYM
ncbi:uncharacterized protein LOC130795208 [Actinidia eriantha]|uniref:uncharacterized protein LOC130795208 n=1 Tax=Actinidia eriantha TaxID=165200 RepID=UPI002583B005|nr:uncharacterized protein LOC130795208 [Actinidia eriantha]